MEWRTSILFFCATVVLAVAEWREVKTAQGTVRGRKHPSGEVYAFYSIPYATAPTGVNKFKAPLPPPQRETYDAVDNHVICPQPEFPGLLPENLVQQENCLIANVFVPDTNDTKLSVLVYIHGGGFITGYGNSVQAINLMKKKDLIVITFNYRLSVHGFLCLGTEDVPGNAGMKDIVALLHWVQENVASFGGNPDDVTLAGGSAGSAAVDLLLLSKSAEGLFHKVIPESGGNLAAFSVQRDPLKIAKNHAEKLKFTDVDDIYALETFYKTASLKLLMSELALIDSTNSAFGFSPCLERKTVNGAILTESPLSSFKNNNYRKLPMLYGFANMEGLLHLAVFEFWKDRMNEKFSDFLPADLKFESDEEREEVANKIKEFYFQDKQVGTSTILGYIDFFSDVTFTFPMLRAVKLHAEAGHSQVYLYEYSFVDENVPYVPYTDKRGAHHSAQSDAVLDGRNETNETAEFQKMRKTIRELWHNFMKTGNPVPESSSLPVWPAARANRSPYMELNNELKLHEVALLGNRTQLWEGIYEKHYRDAIPPPAPSGAGNSRSTSATIPFMIAISLVKMSLALFNSF